MKNTTLRRLLSMFLVVAMILSLAAPALAAENDGISVTKVDNSSVKNPLNNRETAELTEEVEPYAAEDVVRVSIFLKKASTIEAGYEVANIAANKAAMNYRTGLKADQDALVHKIEQATGEELDVVWNLTLAANLISANVKYGQIEKIEAVKGVEQVVIETEYEPAVVSKGTADPNMATSGKQTGSYAAWAAGYTGAGSKVAIIDTGLDLLHEAFAADAFDYSLSLLDGEYDLLTQADIEAVLSELHVASKYDAEDLYYSSKVPFTFSYIDGDLDVSHNDSEHGSHVAGISAANTYVKEGDKFVSAMQANGVQGVAPDAQLLVMQVFGDNGGAYDSDYMVAIEDAIILGADSVNLSLGSGSPGYSKNAKYKDLLDSLAESGVVVVISAGNSGAWNDATQTGVPYLYSDDVSMHTGGSPGTYTNSLGVASVNNDGALSHTFEVAGHQIGVTETEYSNDPLSTLAGKQEFVFIDGFGTPEDWAAVGDAVEGKVAFCSRGETSFYEKAEAAVDAGAIAVVIYNNTDGIINMDLSDYSYTAPVVSITQADAAKVKAAATAKDGYYTGTMTISNGPSGVQYNSEYYTMSSFSSWGVPGSLELKPEITAPGGDIYSVAGYVPGVPGTGHTAYELMSGTSMAAPQVAGMVAVLTQYIRESGLEEKTGKDARFLAQSLLMSTAEPIMEGENEGYYYSVLKQGAGLGNVGNAIAADSYIAMGKDATASYADGKVKAELGDDPDRNGVYTFSFSINNLTAEAKEYFLSADVFTQAVFAHEGELFMDSWTTALIPNVTWKVNGQNVAVGSLSSNMDFNGDGAVDEADGQALLDYATGAITELNNVKAADLNGNGTVTSYDAYLFFSMLEKGCIKVPANGSAEVEVTITLSESDLYWLRYYENGAYIEAYVYAESFATEEGVKGTCHSIPVLGFYGNWSDASMFDKGSYLEYAHGEETRIPYLYNDNGIEGNSLLLVYGDDPTAYYHFGGNPVVLDDTYMPERNAISGANGDMLYRLQFANIRNAGDSVIYLKDTSDDSYLIAEALGQVPGAYYYVNAGIWYWTSDYVDLGLTFEDIPEDTALELGLTLIPEYYDTASETFSLNQLGAGATLAFPFVVDNTAPEMDKNLALTNDKKNLIVTAADNQYVAGVVMYDAATFDILSIAGSNADAEAGEACQFALDVSEVCGNHFYIQVIDYAFNVSTYEIKAQIGELVDVVDSVTVTPETLKLRVGSSATLSAEVLPRNASDRTVTWTSSNNNVATVSANGVVTGVAEGEATITATSNLDPNFKDTCVVTVAASGVIMSGVLVDDIGYTRFYEWNLETDNTWTAGNKINNLFITSATANTAGDIAYMIDTDAAYTAYAVSVPDGEIIQGKASVRLPMWDMAYNSYFSTGTNPLITGVYGTYLLPGKNPMAIDTSAFNLASYFGTYTGASYAVAVASAGYEKIQDNDGVMQDTEHILVLDNMGCLWDWWIYKTSSGFSALLNFKQTDLLAKGASLKLIGDDYGEAHSFCSLVVSEGGTVYLSALDFNSYSSKLYRLDLKSNKYTATLVGDFGTYVYPATITSIVGDTSGANAVNVYDELMVAESVDVTAEEIIASAANAEAVALPNRQEQTAKGSLNVTSKYDAPARPASEDNTITVNVTAQKAGSKETSYNGMFTVAYDASHLKLLKVRANADYISVHDEDGVITFAYVNVVGVKAGETVVELVFEQKAEKASEVKITYTEQGEQEDVGSEKFVVGTLDGWVLIDGKWYYYENGKMVTNNWVKDSKGWCYLGADGAMVTNEWVMDSVGWCYVGADGYCVTNEWVADSKGWCYLDENGRMATNRWVKDSVGWCYVGADGYCVTDEWVKDSVGWCYLDHNGRMATNKWVMDSVGWCYVGADGYCVTNTWKQDSVGWCYLDKDGRMVVSNWVEYQGEWYYLDANGYMVTGRQVIGGKVYYFDENGVWIP